MFRNDVAKELGNCTWGPRLDRVISPSAVTRNSANRTLTFHGYV